MPTSSHSLPRRQFLRESAVGTALVAHAVLQQPAFAQTNPPKPKIKIGQIGVGHAHANKLAVYRTSSDYEVVGLVEPDPILRQRAEKEAAYKDVPLMTQEQLLNVPGLQAVLLETRVRDSLTAAEACIAAGKHVHLDKPAGESLMQYRRILDAAAKQKLLVQRGYMFRYAPGVVLLRDFLKQGWLGDVFEVHAVMSKVVDPGGRKPLAEYPGGILFELGCHVLDLVIKVLGKPAQVAAYNQHVSRLEDKLVDNMLAVLSYPGALATVKASALEVEGFDRRHLTVCGTKGTFHIQPLDNPSARISLSEPRGEYKKGTQEVKLPKYQRYVGDAADMAKIIRGEKESDFSYDHDFVVQETLLKACGVK